MAITFAPATKRQSRARIALLGPPGSGKTYTALTFATALGERIAVIDTERSSAGLYADLFKFDTVDLATFDPELYIEAIQAATKAGYDVLIIDSLSHAWAGKGGVLEMVDDAKRRSRSGNSFTVWRDITPVQNRLVDTILQAPMHVIATMRTKMEYIIEEDEKGKKAPKKVGMAPIQRDGVEYEFDLVADMDTDQRLIVTKTRCPQLAGVVVQRPDKKVAETIRAWLMAGAPPLPVPAEEPKAPAPKVAAGTQIKVETEIKPSPEMKRELAGLIRDLSLSVIDGGAGKPYLVALPVPVLAVLGLPENSPPQDIKTFGLGAYESILPVLRKLLEAKMAQAEIPLEEIAIEVPEEERGVAT